MFFVKQKVLASARKHFIKPITTLKITVKHVFEYKYKENKVLVEDY
jgi:hypothetical protein